MITEKATSAVKAYLAKTLTTTTIYTPRGVDNFTYPCIMITDTASDEHDVLDGVYSMSVEVAYVSIPNANADAGENQDDLTSNSDAVYNLLTCEHIEQYLSDYPNFKCFDCFLRSPRSGEVEGKSATIFEMELVCCQV